MAHRYPLCWHPPPPGQKPRADPNCASRGAVRPLFTRATSSRNSERNHLGTPSDIKSDWWATSSRIRGRLPSESAVETVGVSLDADPVVLSQLRQKIGAGICPPVHFAGSQRRGRGSRIGNDVPLDAIEMHDLWAGGPFGRAVFTRLVPVKALIYTQRALHPFVLFEAERAAADHLGYLLVR